MFYHFSLLNFVTEQLCSFSRGWRHRAKVWESAPKSGQALFNSYSLSFPWDASPVLMATFFYKDKRHNLCEANRAQRAFMEKSVLSLPHAQPSGKSERSLPREKYVYKSTRFV